MTDTLGAAAVRRWFEQGLRAMLAVRRRVDVLNVFPVPDGDTGTNLVLTLAGAARAAGRLPDDADLPALTAAAARGALVGARGNSGVILSQAMRGLARVSAGREHLDGPGLAQALTAAAEDAHRAVDRPVAGTILTVADVAAQAARGATDQSLAGVARAAVDAAVAALADTRSQLPVLAERDVVDAGAAGYVILLEALLTVVGDQRPGSRSARDSLAELWATPRPPATGPACALGQSVVGPDHPPGHAPPGSEDPGHEVMYVLRARTAEAALLRERLATVGDSVAVVGGSDATDAPGLWQVHVHTADPAAALTDPAAMEQVCIRSLSAPPLGVVAATRLPGLAGALAQTGAVVVLHPDPAGLERGVVDAAGPDVLVLTSDEPGTRLAEQVLSARGGLPGRPRTTVVPAGSEVALVAVLAELHPGAVDAQQAARIAGQVRTTGCALADLPGTLAGVLGPQDELVTAIMGRMDDDGARERAASALRASVRAGAPLAEVVILDGGQAAPELLVGVQ